MDMYTSSSAEITGSIIEAEWQGGNQFGIMLRASLEADSEMYYFGGEYDGGKLIYRLSHRASAGDETITDYTLDNQECKFDIS